MILQSEWFSEYNTLIANTKTFVPPNGLEIFIGTIRINSNGQISVDNPQILPLKKTDYFRKIGTILNLDELPYINQLKSGDTAVFLSYLGLKQESHVLSAALISKDKVLSFDDVNVIEVSSGINMNNGCYFIHKIYKINGLSYGYAQYETKGNFYNLHRRFELEQWRASGRSHKVTVESFVTDMAGIPVNNPPKATCATPELIFYQILEQQNPSKKEAQEMWLQIFNLWGNQDQIELYLKKQLKKFEAKNKSKQAS